jgi:hypothetical protein
MAVIVTDLDMIEEEARVEAVFDGVSEQMLFHDFILPYSV